MALPETAPPEPSPVPLLYLTDLTLERFDPADLFDLAFLLRSRQYHPLTVCLPAEGEGLRVVEALSLRAGRTPSIVVGVEGLLAALEQSAAPVNLAAVAAYDLLAAVLAGAGRKPGFLRETVARLFLVGGHVNSYASGREGERVPIDPRLKERHPERFFPDGDPRVGKLLPEFGKLLTSGEAVIWLPRDICLWRYDAPGILAGRGELTEFLLRELFYASLSRFPDRYQAANCPVLLSALPALLLATRPDPFLWMRLFRALSARVTVEDSGAITRFDSQSASPNLYTVVAIDGSALGRRLTETLVA